VPRLFAGVLPNFNIGTHNGASCSAELTAVVEKVCDSTGMTRVTNGRFKGGYTTRHYGMPARGIHAIQMELACRGYMREPDTARPENWPPDHDEKFAASLRDVLRRIMQACVNFAAGAGARAWK
jgi:formiminoglutamase